MQANKPKIQRTYVSAVDPVTKKREDFTIYNATPREIKSRLTNTSACREDSPELNNRHDRQNTKTVL